MQTVVNRVYYIDFIDFLNPVEKWNMIRVKKK